MNHKSTFQSSFGGFTSIVTIFLVFLFFSTNFIDYLAGKNIITKQTQVYDDQLSNLQLNDQDFIMALGIEQNNFISQPYFTLNLQQSMRDFQMEQLLKILLNFLWFHVLWIGSTQFSNVMVKTSQRTLRDSNSRTCCALSNIDMYYDRNQLNMNIGGTFTSNNFNFLKIEVTSCNQSEYTDRRCASEDELKQQVEKIGNFKVQVYIINKVIFQFENRQQTLIKLDPTMYLYIWMIEVIYLLFRSKLINRQTYSLDNINSKIVQIFIHLSKHFCMNLSQDQNSNFISIDDTQTKEITDLGRDSDAVYASFYFRKSPITTLVERKNQSIIDLLSKLGGLFQISFIVMGFIISTYNKITMLVELSNKVYEFSTDFDEQNKQHQQNLKMIDHIYEDKQFRQEYYVNREGQQQQIPNSEIKHKSKILQLFRKHQSDKHVMLIDRPPTENNEYVNQGSNENEDKSNQITQQAIKDHNILAQKLNCVSGLDYFKKQINLILNRSQPLRFNFKIFFNQLCFRRTFQNSLSVLFYNQAVDKINEQLDVFNILTKLNEIDKLKEILLTNSQQLLFDFAAKPIISLIEEKEMHFSRTFLEERARSTIEQYKNKKIRRSQLIQQSLRNLFRTQSLDRDHRIYKRIYRAYDLVLQQSMDQNPQYEVNQKLIKKLGDEIQAIFKLSKLLDFDGIKRLRANSNNDQVCRNTQNIPDEIILK
ncbi:unnamed protein product (macronuclear) [Paramecium tetraurelia]|uniref:Transmembrane protein n=1 Tax=Paramecium tetraurelia TaxID=5888 RepID=A0BS57_PARTE|nr:uncharacterized protein GSPATT00031605001 [Paramecium tetraurelia]CAK61374.1 unnamed protein product [Paramecium tetraurelia]|eukprot:XP_001428772.1 hypothetical protein (macronuclear) [Paramecium tetraurelia strain d4-2]